MRAGFDHMSDDSVRIGTLTLPVHQRGDHAVLGVGPEQSQVLGFVLNSAMQGGLAADFRKALLERRSVSDQGVYVSYLPDISREVERGRQRWLDLTGQPPGDDVYLLGTQFRGVASLVVPRQLLIDVFDHLTALGPAPPPVLNAWDHLEQHALDLLPHPTLPSPDAEIRDLLSDLSGAGVLDLTQHPSILEHLDPIRHEVLLTYVAAVKELTAYYASPQRAARTDLITNPPIIGGPVSLEWFRHGVQPPDDKADAFTWLTFFEGVVQTATVSPNGASETYQKLGGQWFHLRWRCEVPGTRSLTWAARIERP